jgi:transcription elongation factor Elf1
MTEEKFACPVCGSSLKVVDDWVGGGSHYWALACLSCGDRYAYDTYRFKLERCK